MKQPRLEEVLNRHCEFWKRTNKTAVVEIVPFAKWRKKPFPVCGRYITDPEIITPTDIDTDKFLGLSEPLPLPNKGNLVNTVMPKYPQSWMSGIIGCDICASAVSSTAFGKNASDIEKLIDSFSKEQTLRSDWYAYLKKCTQALTEYAGGKVAVSQFHLRGIIDMLSAYFKEDVLGLAVYDYPEKIKQLADKFAELYITVAKNDMAMRGQWMGGNAINWGVYAPGELLSYQVDASNLFSQSMYEQMFIEFDEKIINEFTYSLVHTHYTGLHVIKSLCSIKNLSCIQINLDREAVPNWQLEKVIKACRVVQDAGKCVLINGELSKSEINKMQKELKPQGLMMFCWLPEAWNPMDIK